MKEVMAVCCMFCLSFGAFASEPPARGFYIGGSAGITELDDDGAASDLSGGGVSFSLDESDSSFGLYGGYKILKYLAVEGRLVNLGSYTLTGSDGFTTASEDIDLSVISAHVVGIVPFGASGWELFGQLGLGRMNIDTDFGDEDETAGSAGIGVRWYPIPNLGLSLQVDAWAWEEDDGFDTYDFSVASSQLAIHYLF